MALIPKKYFLTKGVGTHKKEMRAFENALRDAGVQMCNLSKISSIIAPGCERLPVEEGKKLLKPGEVTFAVIAQSITNEPGQLIGAGIGLAQPKDKSIYGYLTEVEEAIGRTEDDIAQDAEEMAIENLVTEWGYADFDGQSVLEAGKKEYNLYGRQVDVDHIALTATGAEDNLFTVVFVAAVFIYDYSRETLVE
jgi:arginine decarboxylase